jgi:hypothetical protein
MMKSLILSWKLFLKKPFSNAVLAIELALAMIVVVLSSNIYLYSQSCIQIIQNSGSRLLYCSDPNCNYGRSEKDFAEKLQNLKKRYSFVNGFSSIYSSVLLFEREHFDKGEAIPLSEGMDVEVYDETTFTNIHLPLSQGSWPDAKLINGRIPCLVGGASADRYHVGDIISGYIIQKSGSSLEKSRDYVVAGILSLPQMSLNLGDCSSCILPASDFFEDMTNHHMFLIVPENLFSGGWTGGKPAGYPGFTGAFVYLDRSCTQAQIDELRNEMGLAYTQLDTEIIAQEQAENGKTLSTLMPFLIILFLVVFLGLICVCMLTTMKNMQTFKIYYLTGCPRRKIEVSAWKSPFEAGSHIVLSYTMTISCDSGGVVFVEDSSDVCEEELSTDHTIRDYMCNEYLVSGSSVRAISTQSSNQPDFLNPSQSH